MTKKTINGKRYMTWGMSFGRKDEVNKRAGYIRKNNPGTSVLVRKISSGSEKGRYQLWIYNKSL